MRNVLYFMGFVLVWTSSLGQSTQVTPTTTQNYIHKITYKKGYQESALGSVPGNDKIETISYFDGLGRPVQSIAVRQGGKDAFYMDTDLITPVVYDAYGRQVKEYLPFAASTNTGRYDGNAVVNTHNYYLNNYGSELDAIGSNPYSEKELESSPLNRILKQAAPGKSWKLGSNNEVKFDYQTNITNEVRLFTVTLTYANKTYTPILGVSTLNNGYYVAGELYKNITKDENWKTIDGVNKTTEEFKDKQGRVVLKRTYNATQKHDTYYVYDDFGNLTYVLPPLMEASTAIITTINSQLSELGYQYRYDHRNRLVEKKIPGKDWEYIVYDKLDRPVLTQDGNLKLQNNWLFTKYDVFGRVAYTGLMTLAISRTTLQDEVNVTSSQWVTKTSATTIAGTTVYYSNSAYPVNNISELYTINYYDDYGFDNDGLTVPGTTAYGTTTAAVKGLPTGSKVRVLGTSNWITSVTGYDQHKQAIWSASKNNYLGTTDIIESELQTMTAWLTKSKTTHKKTGKTDIVTIDTFTYDHSGKLLTHNQKINTHLDQTIAVNEYDALGQLVRKKVGGVTGGTTLQVVDYTYNIRGWLKGINDVNNLGSTDLFGFKLNYNTVNYGATPLYNGNIAETAWRTANTDKSLKWYKYGYDNLNRITSGIDNTADTRYSLSSVVYDKNGNITNLSRRGHTNTGATTFGVMDNLSYTYQLNSNKLTIVSDAGNDTFGFKDDHIGTGADTTIDYTYDVNGNMKTDTNKGITNITYNHLNLPTLVTMTGGTISYIYDATGVKQRKIVSTGATTDYAGNYVYENNTLQFFNQPEGYVEPNGSGWKYVYQYKDHLGNIRLSYKDISTTSTPSLQLVEENNYYPLGLTHKGYNTAINGTHHKYMFGGKEFDESFQTLNTYDFGARNYDPALGRWMNVDPLAEKYPSISPYAYVANNPIMFIDPDGREIVIPKSLKGSERRQIMRNLGKLTNDKLGYNKSTGQVTVGKQRIGNKTSGTTLVTNLISSSKTTTIVVGAEGSGNSAKADSRTSTGIVDWTNAKNGTGDNATVSFDPTANPDIPTGDPKTGNVSGAKRPNQIGLGHELIHADHINNGDVDFTQTTHTYNDANGTPTTQTVINEELRTVGLQGVKAGDVTENNLRKEQRQTRKKQRGAY